MEILEPTGVGLLGVVLDSWDRHNIALLNLLHALPQGGLEARAVEGSPSVAEMFSHMHHERLVSVLEEAPEFSTHLPEQECAAETDPERIAASLRDSAKTVRAAVEGRAKAGRELDLNFGHPVLLLQFLIFHEGYHHGQIKLALKAAGCPLSDDVAGPLTWKVWKARSRAAAEG